MAKDGTAIGRDEIAALDLDAGSVPVRSASDLGHFWRPFIGGGRKMSYALQRYERIGEDRALIHAQLTVQLELRLVGARARAGGATIRNSNIVQIVGAWAAYKRDGKWYLFDPGFPPTHRIVRVK